MQLFQCGQVMRGNGYDRLFKHGDIVGVRQQIAVVEHVDPNLSVRKNLGGERLLDDFARCDG